MVLVYSDDTKLALELLHKAHDLGKERSKKVIAVTIGTEEPAKDYLEHGADVVIVAQTSQKQFKVEEYTSILLEIVKENANEIVLLGSNKTARSSQADLQQSLMPAV
jgi:electron transfer flavoprotein alpha subunit